jgi:hypothetical protein
MLNAAGKDFAVRAEMQRPEQDRSSFTQNCRKADRSFQAAIRFPALG